MELYLAIIILLTIFSLVDLLKNRAGKTSINLFEYLFCFLPLIILVAIRSVGFDYDAYEDAYNLLHYNDLKDIFSDLQFEPGYIIANVISPSYIFLIFLMGTATLLIKFRTIIIISPFPIVSLLFFFLSYYLNFEMGQIRQALAMSITLFSILYFSNKRIFIFLVVIASLFHYSALLFLLLLIIPIKIHKWYFYFILFLVAILCYFTIEPAISKLSEILPGFVGEKMTYYQEDKGQMGISIPIIIVRLLIIILFIIFKPEISKFKSPMYLFIFNIYFLSFLMYIAFAFLPQISGRGGTYFTIFDILLIPIILKAIKNDYFRIAVFGILLIAYIGIFASFITTWNYSFIPYKTWFLKF